MNRMMTQEEACRRLKAMLDALPEDERQQWEVLGARVVAEVDRVIAARRPPEMATCH
jgi:hypothetical protein